MGRLSVIMARAFSPGESRCYYPVAAAVGWARLHVLPSGPLPCLLDDCLLCRRKESRRRLPWLGLLPCVRGGAEGRVEVASLSPDWWDDASIRAGLEIDDLRQAVLTLKRVGKGVKSYAATLSQCSVPLSVEHWRYPTLKQCVLSALALPADNPDYRADLYFRWTPLQWPAADAPALNGLSLKKEGES